MTEKLSDAKELWLALLVQDFACELANQAIQSPSATHASSQDATLAMVRQAYVKGLQDALLPQPDFDADVDAVRRTNERAVNVRQAV